jgi:AcrR family transcriptional regulator
MQDDHDDIETSDLRTRILDTFMERAKVVGVRAISTDDLARTLSISKKTLYKQFRSKEEMVLGILDRWELRIKAELPITEIHNPKQFARLNVERWYEIDAQFTPKFWEDVGHDYPTLTKKYFDCMFEVARAVGSRLMPYMKPNLTRGFVRETYFSLVMHTAQPEFYEKAKVERKDAVLMGLDVWLDGAFFLPESFSDSESQ